MDAIRADLLVEETILVCGLSFFFSAVADAETDAADMEMTVATTAACGSSYCSYSAAMALADVAANCMNQRVQNAPSLFYYS